MNSVKAGSIVVGAMGVTVVFATANNLLTTNKRAPATLIPLGGVLATLGLLGAARKPKITRKRWRPERLGKDGRRGNL